MIQILTGGRGHYIVRGSYWNSTEVIEFSIRYKKNQINLNLHSYCIRLHFNQLKVYQFTFVLLFIDIACVY